MLNPIFQKVIKNAKTFLATSQAKRDATKLQQLKAASRRLYLYMEYSRRYFPLQRCYKCWRTSYAGSYQQLKKGFLIYCSFYNTKIFSLHNLHNSGLRISKDTFGHDDEYNACSDAFKTMAVILPVAISASQYY